MATKMHSPEVEAFRSKIDGFFDACANRLEYLYCRWQDEKEYESWQNYSQALHEMFKHFNPGDLTFVHVNKRPFGIRFTAPFKGKQVKVDLKINSTELKWACCK